MKAEISKKILGKMLSRESTELVIQEIAVEYARWKKPIFEGFISNVRTPKKWEKIEELFNILGKSYSEVDLYKYWINNVYKPKDEE